MPNRSRAPAPLVQEELGHVQVLTTFAAVRSSGGPFRLLLKQLRVVDPRLVRALDYVAETIAGLIGRVRDQNPALFDGPPPFLPNPAGAHSNGAVGNRRVTTPCSASNPIPKVGLVKILFTDDMRLFRGDDFPRHHTPLVRIKFAEHARSSLDFEFGHFEELGEVVVDDRAFAVLFVPAVFVAEDL